MQFAKVSKWCDAADHGLDQVLGHDRDEFVKQVNSGACELWRNGSSWLITRLEDNISELCICCYQGENAVEMMESVAGSAKRMGLKSIRFHTQRKGLQRLLKKFPFAESEIVFKMRVDE